MGSMRACAVVLIGLLGAACGGADFAGILPVVSNDAGVDSGGDARAAGNDATLSDGAGSTQDAGDATDGASFTQDAFGAGDDAPSAQDGNGATDDAPSARDADGTDDGASSARDGTGTTDDAPSTQDAGGANDGADSAQDASDANDDAPSPQDASDAMDDSAPGAACPDVRGDYSIAIIEGQGCTTLNASARQCIRQGPPGGPRTCDIRFLSTVPAGFAAINGSASLQNDGSFAAAALQEGALNRTGCTGTWDPATSTMTVDCGGTGSSQSCVLAVQRSGAVCN
jgi:hypothetical protein